MTADHHRGNLGRLSHREFRAITQKGRGEIFFFSQYIYRPISSYVTRAYAALGLSANAATIHSLVAAVAASGAVLWPGGVTYFLAAVGLQAYFILDHVDGELARLDFWRGVRKPTPAGEYADYWVHLHSLNLTFGALGVGLALWGRTPLWAVLGLVADNCLGSFPKLAMARILWSAYRRDPAVTSHPEFPTALAVVTDTDGVEILDVSLSTRKRLFHLMRELLFYPGALILLSVALVIDAATAWATGSFTAWAAKGYLVFFVVAGVASKIRRTTLCMRQLDAVGKPGSHSAATNYAEVNSGGATGQMRRS